MDGFLYRISRPIDWLARTASRLAACLQEASADAWHTAVKTNNKTRCQWRDAKTDPPESSCIVWAYGTTPKGITEASVCYYDSSPYGIGWYQKYTGYQMNVTHWMELHEEPNEKLPH